MHMGTAPRAPHLWVMYSPQREGGKWEARAYTPALARGLGGRVIQATNSSVQCKVKVVIMTLCLREKTASPNKPDTGLNDRACPTIVSIYRTRMGE